MTEQELIQLFASASSEHSAVKWFDEGPADFLFNPERNIEYPAFFLQSTGSTLANNRIEHSYVAYCVDLPNVEQEVDGTAFQWDTSLASSRDTTLAALTDIVGKVRLDNRQNFILTEGVATQDNDQIGSAIGYRVNFTINMDFVKDNNNFPSNP